MEYIVKNELGWNEGNIVKYVSRWKRKNGLEDLQKAREYLDRLIERVEAQDDSEIVEPPQPPNWDGRG